MLIPLLIKPSLYRFGFSKKNYFNILLFQPIQAYTLALFRFLFGSLVIVEILIYQFQYHYFDEYYTKPIFHFKYLWFEWVPNLNVIEFNSLLIVTIMSFFCVAIGFLYRFTSVIAWFCFSWIFFMESSSYLNHWYFIVLISFLMMWMPLNRAWSIDCYLKITPSENTVPQWCLELMKVQTFLMLFFSGLVKLNSDWLSGNTIDVFFDYFPENPIVKLYHLLFGPYTNIIISWGTVIVELILPWLLWTHRFKILAFTLLSLFLIQNAYILQIGVFPYLSTLCMSLFFMHTNSATDISIKKPHKILTSCLILIYLLVQISLPLRIFFKKDYLWAGTHQTQFAWNMFLAMPVGHIHYIVCQHGDCLNVDPLDYGVTLAQKKKMISNPLSIFQFGSLLCQTNPNSQVYGKSWLSINKRPLRPYWNGKMNICKCSKLDVSKKLLEKTP